MFQLSHKFNAFLGENKKQPNKQKMTTNNEGKKEEGAEGRKQKAPKSCRSKNSCNGNDNVVYQKISIKKKKKKQRKRK